MALSSPTVSMDQLSDPEKEVRHVSPADGDTSSHDAEKASHEKLEEDGLVDIEAEDGSPVDADECLPRNEDVAPQGGLSGAISRVISRVSTKSLNPGPPPDGGWKAWSQAIYAHLIIMNTWGYINSFGVFQTYYATTLSRPPSDISWIGSIQVFLLFFIGTLTGRLTDAGYFRHVLLLGSVFQMVGIFTTSIATEYWQLFLAQGICMGLGNGFLFCPSIALLSTYFSKRRALAMGVAACGSSTGGLVFPVIARQMLPTAGFSWTMRTIGFVQLLSLVVANFGMQPRIPPRKSGPLVEWAAFKDLEYSFYACGIFFCFWGVYFAFYYLVSFSRDIIGMPYTESLNLLLVLNGIGIIGRLAPNHLADFLGPLNVFVPTGIIAGGLVFCWMAVSNTTGLYVWAIFYGIAAGGIQSLFPAGLSSLNTDLRKAGVRIGMVFTINSFATLTGPPIAGAIISAAGGKFYGAQAFAGSVLLICSGFIAAAKIVKSRKVAAGGSIWKARV